MNGTNQTSFTSVASFGITLFVSLLLVACGDTDDGHIRTSKSPEAAADHLSDAFSGADSDSMKNASIASKAIKKGQFQKALYAIETIKAKPDVSFDQGVAINDSLVNLERELIYRAEDGDKKAIAAYELLKRINRN